MGHLEVAGQVIGSWHAGHSFRHIADEVNICHNTVYGVVKWYNQRGTDYNKLTKYCDNCSLVNLRIWVPQLRQELKCHINGNVLDSTVITQLKPRGYIARTLIRECKGTVHAKLAFCTWAQRCQKHIAQQWQWYGVQWCDPFFNYLNCNLSCSTRIRIVTFSTFAIINCGLSWSTFWFILFHW